MDRRKFVRAAGLAGTAGLLSACRQPGHATTCATGEAGEVIEWKMVTAWPRDFPGLGTGANRLAEYIDRLSNGRLKVRVFGGGELVPPFETFDAVERGTAQMGHSTAYYWKGKVPAAQFFCSAPFGLTASEINGWLYYGGGLNLYREAYAPFGIIPVPAGNSGTQMGGWFNKPINSLADIKGLKMLIPGLGGEILQRAGGSPVTTPGSEIFTALQTGTIDATEWVGPWNDLAFGLFRAAKYYYYPGWQETGSTIEALVNQEAFDALPPDLQAVIEIAAQAVNTDMLADFEFHNAQALRTLVNDHGVQLRRFPDEVMREMQKLAWAYFEEMAAGDALFAKIYKSYKEYFEAITPFSKISDQAIFELRELAPGK
jgi:TRAP-type mannitol/chloroaromatic compound transport system substrate-binding protein